MLLSPGEPSSVPAEVAEAFAVEHPHLSDIFDLEDEPDRSASVDVVSDLPTALMMITPQPAAGRPLEQLGPLVHGGRRLHVGARRTYMRLCREFPGHGFSFKAVAAWVADCIICQKAKEPKSSTMEPMILDLREDGYHNTVGMDFVTITPVSSRGNIGFLAIINMFSKYVGLYPVSAFTAEAAATSLLHYFTTFGNFKFVRSDRGTHFTAKSIAEFHKLFGAEQILATTDEHGACGAESTHDTIIMYLRALVHELRCKTEWDSPTLVPLLAWVLNSERHEETGYSPNALQYGTLDVPMFDLPIPNTTDQCTEYIAALNSNLIALREASLKYQTKRADRRRGTANESPNRFQPGDLVFSWVYRVVAKLDTLWLGPYEVIKHERNTVTVRHLVSGKDSPRHVSTLKVCSASREEAYEAALRDQDQHVVKALLAWRGDPTTRTRMQFLVEYSDGDVLWQQWSQDLADCIPFAAYCSRQRPLEPLLVTREQQSKDAATRNATDILDVKPGDHAFWDLRAWGPDFFDQLALPHADTMLYVLRVEYPCWTKKGPGPQKRIDAHVPVLRETFVVNNDSIYLWGNHREFDSSRMILVDDTLAATLPGLQITPAARVRRPTAQSAAEQGRSKRR